jgi:hypothetical protein
MQRVTGASREAVHAAKRHGCTPSTPNQGRVYRSSPAYKHRAAVDRIIQLEWTLSTGGWALSKAVWDKVISQTRTVSGGYG